ncbi:MAG TPA: hypothetical protein VGM90_22465 [Kofleriaceae bacterium]|jgi:hypothetical protein
MIRLPFIGALALVGCKGHAAPSPSDPPTVQAPSATLHADAAPPPAPTPVELVMTAGGPHIEIGKRLGNLVYPVLFTPQQLLVHATRDNRAYIMDVDPATGATQDVYSADVISGYECDAVGSVCVLNLSKRSGNDFSPDDPMSLVVLQGRTATPLEVPGVTDPRLDGLSPDGRFVVASRLLNGPLVALDRTTKQTFSIPEVENGSLQVDHWEGSTAMVRREIDDGPTSYIAWKLDANGAQTSAAPFKQRPLVSPDGKRSVTSVDATHLTVSTNGRTRTLTLTSGAFEPYHDPDRPPITFCCEWIDNRWIGTPVGFIDADAMKLAPFPSDFDFSHYVGVTYGASARFAIVDKESETYFAKIVDDAPVAIATPIVPSAPHLDLEKRLGGFRMQMIAASPTRIWMTDERGDTAALVDIDLATGAMKDLFTTPDRIAHGSCDHAFASCVLELSTPSGENGRNGYGTNDRSRLVMFDGVQTTPLAVPGVDTASVLSRSMSPDGRWIVVEALGAKERRLVAFERTTKQTFEMRAPKDDDITLAGWNGSTALVVLESYENSATSSLVSWRLGANGATTTTKRTTELPLVSPDGARTAVLTWRDQLTVHGGGKPRRIVFGPNTATPMVTDCCSWVDNRWLATPIGLIDTNPRDGSDAMTLAGFVAPPEKIAFIPGARIALVTTTTDTNLVTIVGP